MDKDELIAKIRQAFADTVYPGDERLINANHCDECATIAEVFQGKQWSSLTDVSFLRRYEAALSLLYPEAFRYYLPAYMIAALTDPPTADVIIDSLEYHLTPPGKKPYGERTVDDFLAHVSGFNQDQKNAIQAYLEYSFPNDSIDFDPKRKLARQRALDFWGTFEG